jgi:hypothetical protein
MNLGKIISGMGLLIAVYLFVSNANQTAKIIESIGSNTTSGIKVLQGRG